MRIMLKILMGSVLLVVIVSEGVFSAAAGAFTYGKDVQKVISALCLSCHGEDAPTIEEFKKDEEGFKKKMKGPRMDTYASIMNLVNGSDTGALMRRLDDGTNKQDGKPGNMNRHLGKTDTERAENLNIIKQWIGGWTLKRKADITGEELKAIKALEK
jgi:cytochrome c553